MTGRVRTHVPVLEVRHGGARRARRGVGGEQPLEIRIDGTALATTMRTPGADFELAVGRCIAAGIVDDASAIASIRSCADREEVGAPTFNVLDVALRPTGTASGHRRGVGRAGDAGEVTGATAIAAARHRGAPVADDATRTSTTVLVGLPARLDQPPAGCQPPGDLAFAALADADGGLLAVRADVDAGAAVDKLLGWSATERRRPATGTLLVVSGAVGFATVRTALLLGSPVLAATGAPSDLAVELAAEAGLGLVGSLTAGSMDIYAGGWRLDGPDGAPLGDVPDHREPD